MDKNEKSWDFSQLFIFYTIGNRAKWISPFYMIPMLIKL